ncbi:MAG TPA: ribonuclease III [Firmicutes bacterium]|nr:ribonuclease III [Bacillota bacterium]
MGNMDDIGDAEKTLHVNFRRKELLLEAFTHSSFEGDAGRGNERLEFLGDAVLKLAIASWLYKSQPGLAEGELSALAGEIVSRESLASAASRLDIGRFLRIGKSLETIGGRGRSSVLADAFEAVLGAIFLDKGFVAARAWALKHLRVEIKRAMADRGQGNYKVVLQELLQSRARGVPTYEVVSESGPAHDKTFRVAVVFDGQVLGVGEGKTKKEAQRSAARAALRVVSPEGRFTGRKG